MPDNEEKSIIEKPAAEGASPRAKIGKKIKKIPLDVLFSPGGIFLLFLAGLMEISDFFIPPALADSLILEIIPELIFVLFFALVTKNSFKDSFKAMVWPLIIERFDFFGIIPSFLIKLFL